MVHLDLRAATARQVQQLRFVEFEVWFPPRRDERAAEGFYTPLQKISTMLISIVGQCSDLRESVG